MSIEEIHANALQLPEDQRAILAGELLCSLPVTLVDADDGLEEARRRSAELDEDASAGCSWDEIRKGIRK
jgi:hypothetical protein